MLGRQLINVLATRRVVIQGAWRCLDEPSPLRVERLRMVDHPAVAAGQAAGCPARDDRKVLDGIYWRVRTGSPWGDIPERSGPPTTCANRFRRWAKFGVWDRIFEAGSRAYDGDLQMIDASSIRVHQHGGNVKKGGHMPRLRGWGPPDPLHGAFARRLNQDPRPGGRQRAAGSRSS